MILYYAPGACSLSDHIALIETQTPYRLVRVDRSKRTEDGRDFLAINPKGYVPALELDDGTVLTENVAILAYIAEQSGRLLPEPGLPRWRALEALAFMSTEVHGGFKPFFYPDSTQADKDKAQATLARRFATLDALLGDKPFLFGESMTFPDPFLFVMLSWAARFALEVPERLQAYAARLKALPSVAHALAEEGLA